MDKSEFPALHVYSQTSEGGPAYIVGDLAALQRLMSTLRRALSGGISRCELYAGDGEGFEVYVVRADTMGRMALPYSGALTYLPSDETVFPQVLVAEAGGKTEVEDVEGAKVVAEKVVTEIESQPEPEPEPKEVRRATKEKQAPVV